MIESIFEQNAATIAATWFADLSWNRQVKTAFGLKKDAKHTAYAFFTVERSLSNMDFRERSYLRIAMLLNSAFEGEYEPYRLWIVSLPLGRR